jgi:GNAT superfamily N-acetyltransferase
MEAEDVAAAAAVSAASFGLEIIDRDAERRWIHRVSHLLGTDPNGAFVAETGGRITGVAQACLREQLWCLSLFSVDPSTQSNGVGRALFERALGYGDPAHPGLIVSSNDPRALRMYAIGGFSLRPAFEARGAINRRALPRADRRLRPGSLDDADLLADISRAVRGAPHTPEIEFAVGRGAQIVVFGNRGFAVAQASHGVWLLAARDDEAASALLWAALEIGDGGERPVRWITAGHDWATQIVLRAGLQLSAYGALCVRGNPGPLRPFLPSAAFA